VAARPWRRHNRSRAVPIRLSPTLSFYIGRNFLVGFLMLFGIFLLIILMFDVIELMRRASSKPTSPSRWFSKWPC
jgi:hypothetical protein